MREGTEAAEQPRLGGWGCRGMIRSWMERSAQRLLAASTWVGGQEGTKLLLQVPTRGRSDWPGKQSGGAELSSPQHAPPLQVAGLKASLSQPSVAPKAATEPQPQQAQKTGPTSPHTHPHT